MISIGLTVTIVIALTITITVRLTRRRVVSCTGNTGRETGARRLQSYRSYAFLDNMAGAMERRGLTMQYCRLAAALDIWPFADVLMSGETDNPLLAKLSADRWVSVTGSGLSRPTTCCVPCGRSDREA